MNRGFNRNSILSSSTNSSVKLNKSRSITKQVFTSEEMPSKMVMTRSFNKNSKLQLSIVVVYSHFNFWIVSSFDILAKPTVRYHPKLNDIRITRINEYKQLSRSVGDRLDTGHHYDRFSKLNELQNKLSLKQNINKIKKKHTSMKFKYDQI